MNQIMGKVVKSFAEPAMIAWCRKSARILPKFAANSLGVTEKTILAWEDGTESPSFAQLGKLSKLYKRPKCVFYLSEPPTDFSVMKDFRKIDRDKPREFSPALAYEIRVARERSIWLSEWLVSEGDRPISFIGEHTIQENPASVGSQLRALLGMTLAEQSKADSNDEAFRIWRRKCEAVGVCVFSVAKVEVEEMRGFAIADKYAPVIGINTKDSPSAKCFTLLHEMAHLLIGAEGVSQISFSAKSRPGNEKIEKFCNAVAAEALVPTKQLLRQFGSASGDPLIATAQLAKFYHVSQEVIARRLLELDKVSDQFYLRVRSTKPSARPKVKNREVRIPRFRLALSRVGTTFTRAAVNAFHVGDLEGSELSRLLGMKLNHLSKLEAAIFPSHSDRGQIS